MVVSWNRGPLPSVSERPCPGKPLDTPPYPSPCQRQLTKSGRELFSRLGCPALWLKDPARRGITLPRPRVHCTGLDDIHFKLRDDGALHTPKPRNPTGICDSIEFRFSQDPKNKRTQRGSESHTSVGILGVWLIAKDLLLEGSSPTWRVGLSVTSHGKQPPRSRVGHQRSGIRYSPLPF